MVSNVIASAPGKVVLCGEYAVLDAAPAIAMAVDRRARATLAISNEASSVVTAKAYTKNIGRFQTRDGSIEWQEGQQYFGVIDSVWRAAELSESRAMSIELDSSEFIDSNSHSKLGVGSSAAITVALCAAVPHGAARAFRLAGWRW
jgi:phosphomevalonate kinase